MAGQGPMDRRHGTVCALLRLALAGSPRAEAQVGSPRAGESKRLLVGAGFADARASVRNVPPSVSSCGTTTRAKNSAPADAATLSRQPNQHIARYAKDTVCLDAH